MNTSLYSRTVFTSCLASILGVAVVAAMEAFVGPIGLGLMALCALLAVLIGAGIAALALNGPRACLKSAGEAASAIAAGQYNTPVPQCPGSDGEALTAGLTALVSLLKLTLGNWKGLTEGILIPYALVDTQGRLTFCNQQALAMLERSGKPADCIGMSFSEFFYGDSSRKALIINAMEANESYVREVEFKNIKGNTRFIQAALSPLHDLDGKVSGGLCIYLDFTEIRCQENQITCQGDKIMSTVKIVESISSTLGSTSQALLSQVDAANEGAEQQNRRTEETATAMEQMNATVLEVAKNAGTASERAGQAKAKAREGAEIVALAVEAIHQVEASTDGLKVTMADLNTKAEAIGRIMSVISDIADQTNLLALNAAIEAARAGDAGRGFAVVADEVRKLAEKTMGATKEVGNVTSDIQNGVQVSISGTDKAALAVGRATELAASSGTVLREIVEMVEATSDQVRAIATAAEQQSATSDEINRAVDEVHNISRQTVKEMTSAAESIQELGRLATDLETTLHSLTT